MFGKKVLNKADQKHLRENGIMNLHDMRKQIKWLKECLDMFPDSMPCWECLQIARKLGMW